LRLVRYRGKWTAVAYVDGKRKRISLRTEDRAVAERRLKDLKVQASRPVETVGDIVEAYLEDRRDQVADPDRLYDAWKALRALFAAARPDQVSRDLCRQYAQKRRLQGRSEGTIRKELGTLAAGLRWHDPNTPAVVEKPPAPPPRDRYLSRDEYQQLIAAARSPHVRLAIQLMIATAGRIGAVLDLTWTRVDFEKNRIILARGGPQTAKGRATVPMTPKIREALQEAHRAALTPYVVEYNGGKVKSIKKAFAAAARRADLEGVTPHVIRHTAAVWMAEAGVPMSEIAQYMGHSDSRTTERVYARYSPEYLSRAAEALNV
jgi:integrase